MRNARGARWPKAAALLLVSATFVAATTGSGTVFADVSTPPTEPTTLPTTTTTITTTSTAMPDPPTPDPTPVSTPTTVPSTTTTTTTGGPVDPVTSSTTPGSTRPAAPTSSSSRVPTSTNPTTSKSSRSPGDHTVAARNPLLVGLPVDLGASLIDDRAPVGPPDVSGPAMPSDSVAGAVAELDALRSIDARLVAARSTLGSMATVAAQSLAATTAELADGRKARAVVRAEAADRALQIVLGGGSRTWSGLLARRTVRLTLTVKTALDRRIRELEVAIAQATEARAVIGAAIMTNARDSITINTEIVSVTAKLMAGLRVGAAGPSEIAGPGPSEIAGRAAAATSALAAGRDDGPEQQLLAASIAAQTGVEAGALVASWTATPIAARRATFFALSQTGKQYVYATDGPDQYDCSGLTKRAWAESGIALPHFSGAQLHSGITVASSDLRPGDLLAYGPDGADHVTMYVGAGLVVEAKGRRWGVVVSPAEIDASGGRFAGASRPVP